RRLQIAMCDAQLVRLGQRIGNLCSAADGLVSRQRAFGQPLLQRLAFQKLYDEIVHPLLVADVIEMTNIGMRQRGNSTGFALETLLRLEVVRKVSGQNLDRDTTVEAGIAGAIHFSHPARAELRDDLVRSEFRARG